MLNPLTSSDRERLSRLTARVAGALAAVTCLWLLVRLVWLLLPHADIGTTVSALAPPPAAVAAQSVAKWHLFGNPQSVNLAQFARNAPATTLKLTLRGTLALPDPKADKAMAMIEDEHGIERGYSIGDEVAGAKLTEVYTDHVLLSHEGVAETLQLPHPEAHPPELPEANRQNLAGGQGKASSVPPTYVPPQMANGALDWSRAQKQLQIDPAELARQVHVEPVFENGKVAGARLSGGGQIGTLMSQAGLRPTDLITAVNGTALSGLSNPQQLMDNLQNASSLQVTVMRDGKPATLTLTLR
ncbi:MAG: type II secretion system protein N [Rudaea sp.]|nr:type II secretion system protein N [Rudaea sp.]